jgi:uncharacterized DUF497 family protein
MGLTFEWDVHKAAANLQEHGVPFPEAATVFSDPLGRIRPDPRHSTGEQRHVLLGMSATGRLLTVMFTDRGPDRIRLISARAATRRERIEHEEDS